MRKMRSWKGTRRGRQVLLKEEEENTPNVINYLGQERRKKLGQRDTI
jgi:hypothetical protein